MSDDWKENRVHKNVKDTLEKSEFGDMQKMLRDALPPVDELENGAELRRDLWPEMLHRLERLRLRVPWFDWALLAAAAAAAIFFPALIPALLYHL